MFWNSTFLPTLTIPLTDHKSHQPAKKFLRLGENIFFLFLNSSSERIRYNYDRCQSLPKKLASTQSPHFYIMLPHDSHSYLKGSSE